MMKFLRELEFLHKLNLYVQLFKKNLKKFLNEYKGYIIFVVVMRMNENEDELYHSETILKFNISKLRNWIKCEDATNLHSKWKSIKGSVAKIKVYLTEQNSEIDCTSVISDIFTKEKKKKYTYTYCDEDCESIMKITHSHKYVSLHISLLSFLKRKKLTII